MTPPAKLKLPICIINMVALLLSTIRSIVLVTFLTKSPYLSIYSQTTAAIGDQDLRYVTRSVSAMLGINIVCSFFIVYLVEFLMLLQARTILTTLPRLQKALILTFLALPMTAVLVIQAVWCGYNLKTLHTLPHSLTGPALIPNWLQVAGDIVVVISFASFAAVFTGRIVHTILQRRKLGVDRSRPLEVLATISLESMILPSMSAPISSCRFGVIRPR